MVKEKTIRKQKRTAVRGTNHAVGIAVYAPTDTPYSLHIHSNRDFNLSLKACNNNNNNNNNTDREVTANRPDIIIKNKKEKTCTLIDVAIPTNRNVVQKEAEKKLKYKSLCIEIQRMWNLKCTIVPVIVGATGILTRSLKKNWETIPGKHSIDSLQKTAILGTSHIIRKVLQCEA